MSILVDNEILENIKNKKIEIKPFDINNLGTNSYDLTLNENIKIYTTDILDCKTDNPYKNILIPDDGYILQPNELYICSTNEYTYTDHFVPQINGKSSIGRLGISVHITAGFGDVGFNGKWTLEITVVKPVKIYKNIPIAQIYYNTISKQPTTLYCNKKNNKYSNQQEPLTSKMYMNLK
jgi:dCTP deaminase